MSSQKPRIIPWLIDQINSQEYPGLKWINKEQTRFLIPWKHGLRQDRSDDDVKIFEAWAIASGNYDPRKDLPNPAVWKRNVRSALNRKHEIKVIEDNSKDSTDPHKIYEFIRGDIAGGDVPPDDLSDGVSPSSDTPSLTSTQIFVDRNLSHEMQNVQISYNEEDLYLSPEDFCNLPGAMCYDNILSPGVFMGDTSPVCPSHFSPCPVNEEQPGQAEATALREQETLENTIMEQYFPNNTFETEFQVEIYYRGTPVKKTLVKNLNGFHITSRAHTNPDSNLESVILPPPSLIPDQKVAASIKTVLQSLEQGTLVEVRHGAICAKRLGKCRSFWSMTDTPATHEPNPIDKRDYCTLYNFHQFVKELIDFTEQKRSESPQYCIYICLGEFWPDGRSWKSKLIMVKITPVSMQILHELSYSTGASSLRSTDLNLQISDSLSFRNSSDLLTFLKDFEERMDWD